jgi:hypothetical protein
MATASAISGDHGPIFAWIDGVVSATGKLIHITYDDDWISADYIEKTRQLMNEDCAFVFTGAQVHHADSDTDERLFSDAFPTGNHPIEFAERMIISTNLSVSPGCGLFRRSDLLNSLYLGKLPLTNKAYHGAGPDLMAYLLPLLDYKYFGFVNEPLAHFYAHAGSITIDAFSQQAKFEALKSAYDEAKKFYLLQKFAKRVGLSELPLPQFAKALEQVG